MYYIFKYFESLFIWIKCTNVFVKIIMILRELVERVNDRRDVTSELNEFFTRRVIQFRKTIVLSVSWEIIGSRKTRRRHFIHYLVRPANRSRNRGQVSREKPRVAGSRLVENHFPFSRLSRICDTIEQTFPWRVGWEIGVPPSSSV